MKSLTSKKIFGAVLLALVVVLSLGVMTAAADGPATVAYLDNQSHTIAANSSALYRFDYVASTDAVNHPVTTITLANGTNSGLGFQVWTAETVNDMADNKPIGIGTTPAVNCDTGEVMGSGGCQSPDMTWSGAFGATGTYYVLVMNNTNSQASYMLNITGMGVSLGQGASNAPAAAPAITNNTDDPAKATAIDGQAHSVPANSAVWYSFNYGVNDDGTHPVVMITMPNGANSGASFQVWSTDAFTGGWYNNKPTGVGVAQTIDCNTGEVNAAGGCQSPDLIWKGALGGNGTYYVRVINNGGSAANVKLTVQ